MEKFFSTRPATKVPEPCLRVSRSFRDEAVDRLAHRDARDREFFREVAFGRQCIVGRQQLVLDRAAQTALELLVKRLGGGLVQPSDDFEQRHVALPELSAQQAEEFVLRLYNQYSTTCIGFHVNGGNTTNFRLDSDSPTEKWFYIGLGLVLLPGFDTDLSESRGF